jgi:photosystem II stability/assembly factor-like uncharacterized protein
LAAPGNGNYIYTSIDSGTNWTQQPSIANIGAFQTIASSSDGTKLAAVVAGGGIYTSINSGTNWTQQTSAPIENSVFSESCGRFWGFFEASQRN